MAHRLAPAARAELDALWDYVVKESDSLAVADSLVDSITERFSMLARYPRLGRPRDQDLAPGLRSYPVGDYVILYAIDAGDVLILHILHGRRDIEGLFRT